MDLIKINEIAYSRMADRSSHNWKDKGNKYYHGQRTANLALTLREILLPENSSSDEILTVSAWFHDISNGSENHCALGAEKTRQLLSGLCTQDELEQICYIISVHDERIEGNNYPEVVKLMQDADLLDHLGTFGVWEHFLYATAHGETINEAKDFLLNVAVKQHTEHRMQRNLEFSKLILDEKYAFLKSFATRFDTELEGRVWNLDEIIKNGVKNG